MGRCIELFLRCIGAGIQEVFAHTGVEEEAVLKDDPHLLAQRLEAGVAEIGPVHQDPARAGVVETREQVCQRRLACAARRPRGARIRKRHVLQPHSAIQTAERASVGRIGDFRRVVDNLKNAPEQRQRSGDVHIQVAQRPGRSGQAAGQDRDHANDRTHSCLASDDEIATQQQQERRPKRKKDLVEKSEPAPDHRFADLELP